MSDTSISPRYVIGKIISALVIGEYFQWAVVNYNNGSLFTAPSVYVLTASSFLIFEAIDTEDVDESVKRAQKKFLSDVGLVGIYLIRFLLLYSLTRNASWGSEFARLTKMSEILALFFLLEGFYQIVLVANLPRDKDVQSYKVFWKLARKKDLNKSHILDHTGKRLFYLTVAAINCFVYTVLSCASILPDFLALFGPLWTIVAVNVVLALLYAMTWRVHFYSK